MHALKQRLTYANVLASLSLFLALGGGAYAAGTQTATKTGSRITTVSVPAAAPAGTLVARAGGVRLETAGGYGLQVRNVTAATARYTCQGIHGLTYQQFIAQGYVAAGQTQGIVTDAAEPPALTCRISDQDSGAVTDAFLGDGKDAYYSGHVISDGTQQ